MLCCVKSIRVTHVFLQPFPIIEVYFASKGVSFVDGRKPVSLKLRVGASTTHYRLTLSVWPKPMIPDHVSPQAYGSRVLKSICSISFHTDICKIPMIAQVRCFQRETSVHSQLGSLFPSLFSGSPNPNLSL